MTHDQRKDEDSLWLAERAAEGDRGAAGELLARYLPDLRAFVRLRAGPALRGRESTSDLVQSACREVLTHLDRFRFPDEKAFRSWLLTTAERKIIDRVDHYAAQKRDHAPPVEVKDELLLDRYGRFSSPSRRVAVQDEIERIERAFDLLTEEQREVVTLAYIAGLSRRAIAEQLGKTENAVRIVLHRALARLTEVVRRGDGRA